MEVRLGDSAQVKPSIVQSRMPLPSAPGCGPSAESLRRRLFTEASASISVPSTVKCSVDSSPSVRACPSTALKKR
jgi:hypothetical protein